MSLLTFDLEIDRKSNRLKQLGWTFLNVEYRGTDIKALNKVWQEASVVIGHNLINFDWPHLQRLGHGLSWPPRPLLDTLFLSVLLFPKKPYHRLVKDYHLTGDEANNPLADVRLTQEVLSDLLQAWHDLPAPWQQIYQSLLHDKPGFEGFFALLHEAHKSPVTDLPRLVQQQLQGLICSKAERSKYIQQQPIELAYALAIIGTKDRHSVLPPWLLFQFPHVVKVLDELRQVANWTCSCTYCAKMHPTKALQRYFGYPSFRRFPEDGAVPLQEQVVRAALAGQSILAIFPTGGGKSLTFQLPTLIKAEATHALTVVISPLQSLMKDQVDNLLQRGITDAVTINGLLSPLERTEALNRVREGGANILYISPESLRSLTIFKLLKGRQIDRFVIDEAHCFSSWGQDFRVDYLYIGRFLRKLAEAKNRTIPIPVSCFTATAKPQVIEDIRQYFLTQNDLKLHVYQTHATRTNLSYHVLQADTDEEKFQHLLQLLEAADGPAIIYVSRTKRAEKLAEQLQRSGLKAAAYHGQLESEQKVQVQNAFVQDNTVDVIVATSAFGMGVDKDNVKLVVHYHISDSLENYLQESGRAGRDQHLQAKCYVLFSRDDLDAHFNLLNQTKLSQKEINQLWIGIKNFRKKEFKKSALEIARKAGWDTEMRDLETRVKTALVALEECKFILREENHARVFAQSLVEKSVEAGNPILKKQYQDSQALKKAKAVFKALVSGAHRQEELRIDAIADRLGISRQEVSELIENFRKIGLLSQEDQDLSCYFFSGSGKKNSLNQFKEKRELEKQLFQHIFPSEHLSSKKITLRSVNEALLELGLSSSELVIQNLLNYWQISQFIKKERIDRNNELYELTRIRPHEFIQEDIRQREFAGGICLDLFNKVYQPGATPSPEDNNTKLLEFSMIGLQKKIEPILNFTPSKNFYHRLLLYLHHIRAIELKDGLLIYYNPMKIIRIQENNYKQFTQSDYGHLNQFYKSKTEQIHIVGAYAQKKLDMQQDAMQFVSDYFSLDYQEFLKKYFSKEKRKTLHRSITEERFNKLFGSLSTEQLSIVNDQDHDRILVGAGPGSGKTHLLVHKVASILLTEDTKPDQLLMLTFSRPAAEEFKSRLIKLVGPMAYDVTISTYHSYAFRLMGRLGNLDRANFILQGANTALQKKTIPLDRIQSKKVLVVDEYQDISADEYAFLQTIIKIAEDIRVLVVGDDDQNIYEFRGADVNYMRQFAALQGAKQHFLTINYRAASNLLAFTNRFLESTFTSDRLKKGITLEAHRKENGQIEIHSYQHPNLLYPLIEQVVSFQRPGSTAILTNTNEEAYQVYSALKEKGLPATLLVRQDSFRLANLLEVRTFTELLRQNQQDKTGLLDANWDKVKAFWQAKFKDSANADLANRIISTFEGKNPKKFWAIWQEYVQEARIEDFHQVETEKILVSTMHKAKGKEFDAVFLLLENYLLSSEERKRLLYVAMTRAKDFLSIHSNSLRFSTDRIPNIRLVENKAVHPAPSTLILETSMSDIWLSYYGEPWIKNAVEQLHSGQTLYAKSERPGRFYTQQNEEVAVLSKEFSEKLKGYLGQYKVQEVQVGHIVVWFQEDTGRQLRVVLPRLVLVRKESGTNYSIQNKL